MTQHEANLWWEKQGLALYLWSPKEDMRKRIILIAENHERGDKNNCILLFCLIESSVNN